MIHFSKVVSNNTILKTSDRTSGLDTRAALNPFWANSIWVESPVVWVPGVKERGTGNNNLNMLLHMTRPPWFCCSVLLTQEKSLCVSVF